MSLPDFLARQVAATTLSLLRSDQYRNNNAVTVRDLARDVFRRFGGVSSGRNYAEFYSIVNQANGQYEAGTTFTPGGPAAEPPRSTTIPADQPQYEYRVIVGSANERGQRTETMLVIRSDTAMSYDQLRAEALDTINNTTPQPADSAGRKALQGMTPDQVIVLTAAGRR